MFKPAKDFLADQSAATAVEYALLCMLIALALVGALGALGGRMSGEFVEVNDALRSPAVPKPS